MNLNFSPTDPRNVPPTTQNRTLPSGGRVAGTATQTAGPGQPGASGGFANLVTGNGGFPSAFTAPIQARQTSPENPAFSPTPSTFQPGTGSNVTQNGSGLYGGQNLPPQNVAKSRTIPQQPYGITQFPR